MKKQRNKNPIQPVMGTEVPRYAGPNTFARLPELRDVESCDVAIVGIPLMFCFGTPCHVLIPDININPKFNL